MAKKTRTIKTLRRKGTISKERIEKVLKKVMEEEKKKGPVKS